MYDEPRPLLEIERARVREREGERESKSELRSYYKIVRDQGLKVQGSSLAGGSGLSGSKSQMPASTCPSTKSEILYMAL